MTHPDDSPFDFDPKTVCSDCFTIRACSGTCLCPESTQ